MHILKKNKYFFATLLFLFAQILVTLRNYQETFANFYWFCDFAPMLLAGAFFLKDTQFAKAVVNVGLIPQVIYIFSFSITLLTDAVLIKTISLTEFSPIYTIVSFFIHSVTLLALLFTYKEKTEKRSLAYSLCILAGMYFVTLLLTSKQDEFNYIYSHASLTTFPIPYYIWLWIPLAFILLVLPTYFLQKRFFEWRK